MFLRARPVRLETERIVLRLPAHGDFHAWTSLRQSSRDFLTRWEPVRIGIWPIVALREAEDLFSALHHCDVHCCKNPIRTFLINQFAPLFEIRVNCGTMLVL